MKKMLQTKHFSWNLCIGGRHKVNSWLETETMLAFNRSAVLTVVVTEHYLNVCHVAVPSHTRHVAKPPRTIPSTGMVLVDGDYFAPQLSRGKFETLACPATRGDSRGDFGLRRTHVLFVSLCFSSRAPDLLPNTSAKALFQQARLKP